MTDNERQMNQRAYRHALAQQALEGLTVTRETQANLKRAAEKLAPISTVIADLYKRYAHVEVFKY